MLNWSRAMTVTLTLKPAVTEVLAGLTAKCVAAPRAIWLPTLL